jgi:hypothetical protein
MKSKLALVLILLISLLVLVPPMFTSGGIFNVQYEGLDEKCNKVILNGLYFDNVFYIIMYTLIAFLGFTIPFLVEKLNKHLKKISTILGAWFFCGFINGIFQISIPSFKFSNDAIMFTKLLMTFVIGLFVIIASDIWSKQKN